MLQRGDGRVVVTVTVTDQHIMVVMMLVIMMVMVLMVELLGYVALELVKGNGPHVCL